MRIVAIALVVAGCFTKPPRPQGGGDDAPVPDDGPDVEGFLSGYAARKRVDITPPTQTALVDFPIVIASIADPDIAALAKADGTDLVATADDGTTLLHSELVSYATGTFELWVDIPLLDGPRNIYIYYGNPAITAARDPATWSQPFAGVWHLSGTAGETDSTSNGDDLGGVVPPASVPGQIGNARSFDGVDDALLGGNPTAFQFGMSSFSYSLWTNVTAGSSQFGTGFFKGGTNSSEPGFCMLMGTAPWTVKIQDMVFDNFAETELGPAAGFTGRWLHIFGVVDRTAQTLTTYVDGQLAGTDTTATIGTMTTTQPFKLSHNDGGEPFKGALDEVHVYREAMPQAWVRTEHANQAGSGFLSLSAEQRP